MEVSTRNFAKKVEENLNNEARDKKSWKQDKDYEKTLGRICLRSCDSVFQLWDKLFSFIRACKT